jgi:hypothetical protein
MKKCFRPATLALIAAVVLLMAAATECRADTIETFTANLTGVQAGTTSTATGSGTVVLDLTTMMITVDESWSNLTSGVTASHIHCCAPPGTGAPILFPLALGTGAGSTTGSVPEQMFAITGPEITSLQDGLMYFNVHTTNFPGGEIRGQIVPTPEPASIALLGTALGLIALGAARRLA